MSAAGEVLYLAVVEDGQVQDVEPHTFVEPTGLAPGARLAAMRDEAEKVVASLSVERVRILDPEATYAPPAVSVRARFAMETLLALGAADAGADCGRLSRAATRSLLGLPKKGTLTGFVAGVTPKVGKHWTGKRDLAALAALAAERQA